MRVLVTGASGLLGREAVRQLRERGHAVIACDHAALEITDASRTREVIARREPEAVLHCAAIANVDACERDPDSAFRVNAEGTANVARAAGEAGARLMYVSTDYVFDGGATEPYTVDAPVAPVNVYGRSKLEGERAAQLSGDALIARTSWLYGRGGTNYASTALQRARAGESLRAIADRRSAPTWVNDTADVMIRLLEAEADAGTYHVNNSGVASWYEWTIEALSAAKIDVEVTGVGAEDLGLPATRPTFSAMDVAGTERIIGTIRSWSMAIAAAVEDGL